LAFEIDAGDLERRITEIEAIRCFSAKRRDWRLMSPSPALYLAHANLPDASVAKCQRLLDGANHHDARCPIRQGYRSRGERAEHVDDRHGAGGLLSASAKAVD
jgi:hypothetical protein